MVTAIENVIRARTCWEGFIVGGPSQQDSGLPVRPKRDQNTPTQPQPRRRTSPLPLLLLFSSASLKSQHLNGSFVLFFLYFSFNYRSRTKRPIPEHWSPTGDRFLWSLPLRRATISDGRRSVTGRSLPIPFREWSPALESADIDCPPIHNRSRPEH